MNLNKSKLGIIKKIATFNSKNHLQIKIMAMRRWGNYFSRMKIIFCIRFQVWKNCKKWMKTTWKVCKTFRFIIILVKSAIRNLSTLVLLNNTWLQKIYVLLSKFHKTALIFIQKCHKNRNQNSSRNWISLLY